MTARGKKAGGQSVGTNFSQKSFTLRPKSSVRGRQSGSAYTCPMICSEKMAGQEWTTEGMAILQGSGMLVRGQKGWAEEGDKNQG